MSDDLIPQKNTQFASTTSDDPFADIKAEMQTRYDLLPEDVKALIVNDKYERDMFDIAKANKLTYEELGILQMETTMVLLGMTRPEEYRDELQTQLKKNDPEINAVVEAVDQKVFSAVHAGLEKIFSAKKDPADFLEDTGDASAPSQNNSNIEKAAIVGAEKPGGSALSTAEKTLLEQTGVVLNEPKVLAPTQPASAPLQERSDMLKSIENPHTISSPGIVANKLSATGSAMATKTTDYSIPKPPGAPQTGSTQTKSDPYREPIE